MVEDKVKVSDDPNTKLTDSELMAQSRRKFTGQDGKENFYIAVPTAEDVRGADWNYSKVYTSSLVEGITTSSEMMDILMRRGIVGPEFEQRQRELNDELANKVIRLQESTDVDEKQLLAMEVANAREELFNWNQRLNGPMSNTCEQIADDARLEYLTSRVVECEDNSKVWEKYEDFLHEKKQGLALRSRFEVMLYLQGLESDFLETTPEAVAMKEIETEIQKKAAEALKELDKEKVDDVKSKMSTEPEIKTDKIEPEVKKVQKKGRPKSSKSARK